MVERVLYVAPLAASRKTTSRYSGWMPLRMPSRYGSAGERAGLGHAPWRNGLQPRDRAGQRHPLDLRAVHRPHRPMGALWGGIGRFQPEGVARAGSNGVGLPPPLPLASTVV